MENRDGNVGSEENTMKKGRNQEKWGGNVGLGAEMGQYQEMFTNRKPR